MERNPFSSKYPQAEFSPLTRRDRRQEIHELSFFRPARMVQVSDQPRFSRGGWSPQAKSPTERA